MKGGKNINISKTGNLSNLDPNQEKSFIEIIIDDKSN
jgi:hypothetical protein